jgi:cellulose biosynthesis protein BcsQ
MQTSTAKRFTIFNHKGGVGKTTLTMNIAAVLTELGKRVLLVDSDPQCNLTSYLLEEPVVDDILDSSDSGAGRTIWSAVKPIVEGEGPPRLVEPFATSVEGLYLVPGDIQLSEFEGYLSDSWIESLQRRIRGFKGTTAISDVVTALVTALDIDYVFYDSGPNIGPLNRAVLLDCDYFIVPVACDLFSLRALKTLGRTLVNWIATWETVADLAPAGTSLLPGHPCFLGYIPERFKIYAGALTVQHARFLGQIDREIQSQIVNVLRTQGPGLVSRRKRYALGALKDFGTLVAASQREGRPLYNVSSGTAGQRRLAYEALFGIAKAIDQYVIDAGRSP